MTTALQRTAAVAVMLVCGLLLAGCAWQSVGKEATEPVTIVNHVMGNDPVLDKPASMLVNSDEELAKIGSAQLSALGVDFSRQSLVVVALGTQATDGYWVRINSAQRDSRNLFVQATANRPGTSDMVNQVIHFPYAAAVMDKVQNLSLVSEVDSVEGQNP